MQRIKRGVCNEESEIVIFDQDYLTYQVYVTNFLMKYFKFLESKIKNYHFEVRFKGAETQIGQIILIIPFEEEEKEGREDV